MDSFLKALVLVAAAVAVAIAAGADGVQAQASAMASAMVSIVNANAYAAHATVCVSSFDERQGPAVIQPGSQWKFQFANRGATYWSCNFYAYGAGGKLWVANNVPVFPRSLTCKTQSFCEWQIRNDGFYLLKPTGWALQTRWSPGAAN